MALAVASLLVAVLAFWRDLFGVEIATGTRPVPPASAQAPAVVTPPSTPAVVTPSPTPAARSAGPVTSGGPRSLGTAVTELTAVAGGANIDRVAGKPGAFSMGCATNAGEDTDRWVRFDLAGRYTRFRGTTGTDQVRDDVQIDARVAGRPAARNVLKFGQRSADLSADVSSASTLELRLTCRRPGGAVIFSDAVVTQ